MTDDDDGALKSSIDFFASLVTKKEDETLTCKDCIHCREAKKTLYCGIKDQYWSEGFTPSPDWILMPDKKCEKFFENPYGFMKKR